MGKIDLSADPYRGIIAKAWALQEGTATGEAWLRLTAELVSAFVCQNKMDAEQLPALICEIHAALQQHSVFGRPRIVFFGDALDRRRQMTHASRKRTPGVLRRSVRIRN